MRQRRGFLKEIKDLTILVVDDEPDLGELVAFEFELVGANVLSASNGKEALDLVQNNNIDVVVSDIRMPGGDGVELLENLRAKNPKSPTLVFMTGFADITLEDAYDKGAVAMFGKPFNRNELIDTVRVSVLDYSERWGAELTNDESVFKVQAKLPNLADAKTNQKLSLGSGGLFISVEDKVPAVSDLVHFKIELENDSMGCLEGDGVVRWVRRQGDSKFQKGFGLEIKNIVGTDREKFFDILSKETTVAFIPKS